MYIYTHIHICIYTYTTYYILHCSSFPGGSDGKVSTAMQETWVRSLGREDHLGKELATPPVFLPNPLPLDKGKITLVVEITMKVGEKEKGMRKEVFTTRDWMEDPVPFKFVVCWNSREGSMPPTFKNKQSFPNQQWPSCPLSSGWWGLLPGPRGGSSKPPCLLHLPCNAEAWATEADRWCPTVSPSSTFISPLTINSSVWMDRFTHGTEMNNNELFNNSLHLHSLLLFTWF